MIQENELSKLYDLHSHDIYRFIYGFLQSNENAEDVTHDTFIRLIEYSAKKNITSENARPLLFTIARNLCIDFLRKNKRIIDREPEPLPDKSTGSAIDQITADELRDTISSLLGELDPATRAVFLLRKESGMQFKEVARTLHISERTAKRKMEKALQYLYNTLHEKGYIK